MLCDTEMLCDTAGKMQPGLGAPSKNGARECESCVGTEQPGSGDGHRAQAEFDTATQQRAAGTESAKIRAAQRNTTLNPDSRRQSGAEDSSRRQMTQTDTGKSNKEQRHNSITGQAGEGRGSDALRWYQA